MYENNTVDGWAGWYYEQCLPDSDGKIEWYWEVDGDIVVNGFADTSNEAEAQAVEYIKSNYDPPSSVIG